MRYVDAIVLLTAPLLLAASVRGAPDVDRRPLAVECVQRPVRDDALGTPRPLPVEHRITEGTVPRFEHPIEYTVDIDPMRDDRIVLRGTLQIGVARAFARVLESHPRVVALVLDSDGGNVYQARALAALVLGRALDTHVRRRCHSACTIVYVAGARRTLAEGAEIGFHCYRLDRGAIAGPPIDVGRQQAKDAAFFAARIPDADFVDRIFRCRSPELWRPTPAMLLEGGVVHEIVPD